MSREKAAPARRPLVTPRQAAAKLGIRYVEALELCRAGAVKAEKINCRWHIDPEGWKAFRVRNQKALEKLTAEYVRLYQSGLSVEAIQRRVEGDLNKRRIAAERRGFAERVIYMSAMEEAKHG